MPSQLLDDQKAKIEYDVLKPTTMSLKRMTKRKINKIKALKTSLWYIEWRTILFERFQPR